MNIGIIGVGGRATAYVAQCLSGVRDNVSIKAIADIDTEKMKRYNEKYFTQHNSPTHYTDYKLLLEDEEIDAVVICTPDTTHKDITIAALKKDKHILLEKPMATTVEDCIAIYNESLKHDKVLRLGFVLRYTNIYSKIKELVSGGVLGKLVTVEAKETLGYLHGASFFRRWHRYKKNNGGFLNAKCSHDMDILNWIINDEPQYVSAFGGRSYFNYNKDAAINCKECSLKNRCKFFYKYEDYGVLNCTEDICPFNTEKDIVDHEVVNIEYSNSVTAGFTVSMLSAEATRTMVLFGTDATLHADFSKGIIEVKYIYPKDEVIYKFDNENSGHGGGDEGIYCNFIDSIRNEIKSNINDARAGLLSSLIALSAEISMEERKIVNLPALINAMCE